MWGGYPWRRPLERLLQLGQRLVERGQEAVVLRSRPVGDPHVPGAAQVLARADDDASPGQAVHDRVLVAVAQVDPGEVGLRVAVAEAAVLELHLHVDALDRRALD